MNEAACAVLDKFYQIIQKARLVQNQPRFLFFLLKYFNHRIHL